MDHEEAGDGCLENGLYCEDTRGERVVSFFFKTLTVSRFPLDGVLEVALIVSRAEGKRLTKKAAMTVAAYKVWQQLKEHEEIQAENRRLEEEAEEASDVEEEGERMVISKQGGRGGCR